MITIQDFDLKLDNISNYMLIVYKEVNQNNTEMDNKSNNMIVLLGIMISLQATIIFSTSLESTIIMMLSLLFYFIGLILFVYSYYLKKFNVAPNNNQLIDYGKDNNVSSNQMIVSLNCDLNDAINHNVNLITKKGRIINYGMCFLIIGVLSTVFSIVIYLI